MQSIIIRPKYVTKQTAIIDAIRSTNEWMKENANFSLFKNEISVTRLNVTQQCTLDYAILKNGFSRHCASCYAISRKNFIKLNYCNYRAIIWNLNFPIYDWKPLSLKTNLNQWNREITYYFNYTVLDTMCNYSTTICSF